MAVTVLVADDSSFMRKLVDKVLSTSEKFRIIGFAKTGTECITKLITLNPKVLILDIMLPDFSGINIAYQVMRAKPTPILFFSSLTADSVKNDSRVFDYGIVDFIEKPDDSIGMNSIEYLKKVMIPKLTILSKLRIEKFRKIIDLTNSEFKLGVDHFVDKSPVMVTEPTYSYNKGKVVMIGASTGGPQMVSKIISELPSTFPPVFVVQHIPPGFMENFARRVDKRSKLKVVLAADGMPVKANTVYLAPGGKHMEVIKSGGTVRISLNTKPMVNFVRPSVDVTLFSLVKAYKGSIVVLIMTGMGKDGLKGCESVYKLGGKILALNEEDSVVYGMNRAVVEAGFAHEILPLDKLPMSLKSYVGIR